MKTSQMKDESLESVLLEFHIESGETPKPGTLESYCRRYPRFARELADYALAWLVDDALATDHPLAEQAANESSPLVSRAISRLYDRIRERETGKESATRSVPAHARNPFHDLPPPRKRAICVQLDIDMTLFAKFQSRLIDPDSAPRTFIVRFARSLEDSVENLLSYLRLPAIANAAADFKAERKPSITPQKQRFEDAVRASSLSEKQKRSLLES